METLRNKRWILPAVAMVAATATNGVLPGMGALFLLPLLMIFWYFERFSGTEMGFVLDRPRHYGLGLLHPALVLSLLALFGWSTGATNIQNADWSRVARDFTVAALTTMLATIMTEDGFFRGWLWASLHRAGLTEPHVAVVTGIAFGVWHLPYGLLGAGYDPFSELPLYIINASVIGIAWGILRLMSGSLVVVAVIHGIWNAIVYEFFNNGAEIGVLGIQDISIFGPEAGVLALVLNLGYTVGLWLWYRRAKSTRVVPMAGHSQPEPGASL